MTEIIQAPFLHTCELCKRDETVTWPVKIVEFTPSRIQRKRTKNWRMPKGAICIGRPTDWGNPFIVGESVAPYGAENSFDGAIEITDDNCLIFFEMWTRQQASQYPGWLMPLLGKNLSCWCNLSRRCHADILINLIGTRWLCEGGCK